MSTAADFTKSSRLIGLVIVVAFSVTHFAVALQIGMRPFTAYFTAAWALEVGAFLIIPFTLWAAIKLFEAFRRREQSPTRYIANAVRSDRERFVFAAILLCCYALVSRSYRAIKVAIPRLQEYYADLEFIAWDRALFGTDPWLITHSLIGPIGTRFIEALYSSWFIVIMLVYGFCAFAKDRSFQLQSCATYLLIWIVLGNALAIYWSSVGPVYYEHFFGETIFTPLTERLADTAPAAVGIQTYLLSTTGDESIGSGISAMPSIHCAMTMLFVVMAWDRRGVSPLLAIALFYHVVILVGSVHLGWHYAVDGLISSVLVPILWVLVSLLFSHIERARPQPSSLSTTT